MTTSTQVQQHSLTPSDLPQERQLKAVVTEHRDEQGRLVRTTRTYRLKAVQRTVDESEAKRRQWHKYGDSIKDGPGPNPATTILGEPVFLKLSRKQVNTTVIEEESTDASNKKSSGPESKMVQCRLCQGPHWTSRCPYKDKFAETADEAGAGSTTATTSVTESKEEEAANAASGIYITPAMRAKMNVSTQTGGGDVASTTFASDEGNTIRISNLQSITTDQDIRSLCTPFGPLSRVFVAKNDRRECKGFAFVTFMARGDAEKAAQRLNGHAYGHVIIKAEIAKPQSSTK